jgi:hypothetical protein
MHCSRHTDAIILIYQGQVWAGDDPALFNTGEAMQFAPEPGAYLYCNKCTLCFLIMNLPGNPLYL